MSQTEVQLIKADAVQTTDIANSAVTDAKISGLTSSKLTGALPAISGAALTGISSAGKAHNLIINGAMQVAQRSAAAVAVSDGNNEGYQTIDRMHFSYGNSAAGAANISQDTDAPTTLGFTKSHKTDVTTINSTSSGNGVIGLKYGIEGQDLRSSGWNHLSASSFLTFSFYFKTTKTGTSKLPIMFRIYHGTAYYYVQNVTVTDPTNWNRYTVTIPGNSNLTINDLNTQGMAIFFSYQTGSDKDTSSEGSWSTTNAYSTSESTNYFDSTSNDMFITGIQLEVGSTATDFEHRSFADELARCQRYFQVLVDSESVYFGGGYMYDHYRAYLPVQYYVEMRSAPSFQYTSGTNYYSLHRNGSGDNFDGWSSAIGGDNKHVAIQAQSGLSGTGGHAGAFWSGNAASKITFESEL